MADELERCSDVVKGRPAPDGWTLEAQLTHPGYGPMLTIRVRCELEDGHDGPHRSGLLAWHNPPALFVGGEPFTRDGEPWPLFGELVA